MKKFYDVVVGAGIAAHAILWWGYRNGKFSRTKKILWIKSPAMPICSLSSIGLVSRAGLHLGVSELGDYLVKGYDIFEQNFADHAHVERARQINFSPDKRYLDAPDFCYLVDSEQFLRALERDFSDRVTIKTATLLSYDEKNLRFDDGSLLNFERCLLALGASNNLLVPIAGTRTVAGQYAQCALDLGRESFVRSLGPDNLIYSAKLGQLFVGSLDHKDDAQGFPVQAARPNALKKFLAEFEFDLPSNLAWKIHSGVRHKGVRRQPFWGALNPRVDSIHSLYKNGFSLAWLGASELL